jgi:hypothetical protein
LFYKQEKEDRRKMDGTFFLFAVIVAVVSSVTSAVAADVDDEED